MIIQQFAFQFTHGKNGKQAVKEHLPANTNQAKYIIK